MLEIPFVKNPGKACALACNTMTANYFFPGTAFDQLAEISSWEKGYVVWPFKFWLWMMDQGIKITDYDVIDYQLWSEKGAEGLKEQTPEKEFQFYLKNVKNLDGYLEDIRKVIAHKKFTYFQKKPTFENLKEAFNEGAVCEVVLDSCVLDGIDGFSLHRVVVLDIDNKNIVFHDPKTKKPRPKRSESIDLFKEAWLGIKGPELCIYKK